MTNLYGALSKLRIDEYGKIISTAVLMLILAWAPFPLGSNREWSWSILLLLGSVAWLSWSVWGISSIDAQIQNVNRVALPLILVTISLCWSVIQVLSFVPAEWKHPLWQIGSSVLNQRLAGSISLNPWKTITGTLQLSLYVATAWLTYSLTRNPLRASRLFNCVIAVGAFYACYAFLLYILHVQQFDLFYSFPFLSRYLSGPFVQTNNFATYEGLIVLASVAALVDRGYSKIITSRGVRRALISAIRAIFGTGAAVLIATILTVSALLGTGSRGGTISTVAGILCMAALGAVARRKKFKLKPALIAIGIGCISCVFLFFISGSTLADRLAGPSNAETVRISLWEGTARMVRSSPLLGLGLGTFEDAYPMYASEDLPYLMDRAHNDYLELAAGLGLPAAICWWTAISLVLFLLAKGVLERRRDRMYPLVAVGATILVAVHSLVDFSLQIPGVSITYSVLLGVGLAQSFPSGIGSMSVDDVQDNSPGQD